MDAAVPEQAVHAAPQMETDRWLKPRFPGAHLLVQQMQKNNKNLIKTNYTQSNNT